MTQFFGASGPRQEISSRAAHCRISMLNPDPVAVWRHEVENGRSSRRAKSNARDCGRSPQTGRKSDEECSVSGRARCGGLPLGLGSVGSIGRHQQGRRRLFVRRCRQRGARRRRRTASRSPSRSSPTPPATASSIPVYVGAQVAANAFGINLIRLGSEFAGRRHPARNPDPQPDRQRPDDQRRDHDDAAGRRLQRHRQEARGEGRRRSPRPIRSTGRSTTAAISATPARTRARRRSAARRSSSA